MNNTLVPIPNAIAGIIIGVLAYSWLGRLGIPFVWGISWCFLVSIVGREERDFFIKHKKGQKAKWDMSPVWAFYYIEYMTASTTALLFSIITGLIKDLIF